MKYKIQIQPSGRVFQADAEQTILQSALEHNLALPFGCKAGACGSCKCHIVEGQVQYDFTDELAIDAQQREQGEVLICQARPISDLVLNANIVEQSRPIKHFPCKVHEKTILNHDVVRLILKCPPTESLDFLPGQYIDILLPDGQRRSFSIANGPHHTPYIELHIRHVEGGEYTGYVFDTLREKALLRVEGPLGSFFLREQSHKPVLFMAGGTGFAPVKSMVEYAIEQGLRREMIIYWGARSREDLYLHQLATDWAAQYAHIDYIPVLSEPAANEPWDGKTGLVHECILQDIKSLSRYEVYACGPPAMVKTGAQAFMQAGLPADSYYSDAFEFQSNPKQR